MRWARAILVKPRLLVPLLLVLAGGGFYLYLTYHRRSAERLLLRGQVDQASYCLQAYCRVWPWNSDIHFLSARVARLKGDFSRAEYHLTRCLKLEGGATQRIQLEFLLIRAQSGEIDELAPQLFEIVERPDRSAESLVILEALAKTYMQRLRFRPAYACLSRWIELEPVNPKPYHWRGWTLERLSNSKGALADFLRALEFDPNLIDVRLRVVEMYLEEKQGPDAFVHAEYLMKSAPDDPRVWARMGICRFILGDDGIARELMTRAEPHLPNDPALLVALANLELQSGNPTDAIRRLKLVLQEDPSDTEAMFVLATAYRLIGKQDESQAVLVECQAKRKIVDRIHELLKDTADTPNAKSDDYAEIGELFLTLGRDKFGLYWLQQALERNPGNIRANTAMATYYDKTGDAQAAANYRRMLRGR